MGLLPPAPFGPRVKTRLSRPPMSELPSDVKTMSGIEDGMDILIHRIHEVVIVLVGNPVGPAELLISETYDGSFPGV